MPTNRVASDANAAARPPMSALGKGVENAFVVVLFFGGGFALDRWLGTRPWLTIVFAVLGLVGQFARMYYAYDNEMREHDARRVRSLGGESEERPMVGNGAP